MSALSEILTQYRDFKITGTEALSRLREIGYSDASIFVMLAAAEQVRQ